MPQPAIDPGKGHIGEHTRRKRRVQPRQVLRARDEGPWAISVSVVPDRLGSALYELVGAEGCAVARHDQHGFEGQDRGS